MASAENEGKCIRKETARRTASARDARAVAGETCERISLEFIHGLNGMETVRENDATAETAFGLLTGNWKICERLLFDSDMDLISLT